MDRDLETIEFAQYLDQLPNSGTIIVRCPPPTDAPWSSPAPVPHCLCHREPGEPARHQPEIWPQGALSSGQFRPLLAPPTGRGLEASSHRGQQIVKAGA